jgi:hypothetical protein
VVKDYFRATCLEVFYFTCFIVRGALFAVFRAKIIGVTSNLQSRSWDLRTRLKIYWKPVCPRRDFVRKYIYIVCLFDRNQNLLCTPLVYMHEYGPSIYLDGRMDRGKLVCSLDFSSPKWGGKKNPTAKDQCGVADIDMFS